MYWVCLTKEELECIINTLGSVAWDYCQSRDTKLHEEASELAELEEKLQLIQKTEVNDG